MPTTFNVLFLGIEADIDPDEGPGGPYALLPTNPRHPNALAENASSLIGRSYGTIADPLANSISDFQELSPISFAGGGTPDSDTSYDQSQTNSSDTFSINGGPAQTFDSVALYNVTITYVDSTTANITGLIIQDTNGRIYLAPEGSANADQAALEAGPIRSITLDSEFRFFSAGLFADRQSWDLTNVVCFTTGTLIKTQGGEIAVENLAVGDMVLTMDNNYRWIGSKSLDIIDLTLHPKLGPVRICAGAIGNNQPETDLTVSPQHRVLVRSVIAKRMFGTHEVLLPAIKLVELDGIEQVQDATEVTYWHILFDDHQIIFSNGAPTESLFTGPEALKSLSPESREEITQLFPEISVPGYVPTPARPIPAKGKLMKQLVARHAKNNKALLEAKE